MIAGGEIVDMKTVAGAGAAALSRAPVRPAPPLRSWRRGSPRCRRVAGRSRRPAPPRSARRPTGRPRTPARSRRRRPVVRERQAAELVVQVRVGAGQIEHDVRQRARARGPARRRGGPGTRRRRCRAPGRCRATLARLDVRVVVLLVHRQREDARRRRRRSPPCRCRGARRGRRPRRARRGASADAHANRHGHVVEHAEAFAVAGEGVVEAAADVHGDAVGAVECEPGGGERAAGHQPEAVDDRRRAGNLELRELVGA